MNIDPRLRVQSQTCAKSITCPGMHGSSFYINLVAGTAAKNAVSARHPRGPSVGAERRSLQGPKLLKYSEPLLKLCTPPARNVSVVCRPPPDVYSRSLKNPALQLLQKSAKSASTTPQRPIWHSFGTVGVRDF